MYTHTQNPFIYAASNTDFKRAFARIIKLRYWRRTDDERQFGVRLSRRSESMMLGYAQQRQSQRPTIPLPTIITTPPLPDCVEQNVSDSATKQDMIDDMPVVMSRSVRFMFPRSSSVEISSSSLCDGHVVESTSAPDLANLIAEECHRGLATRSTQTVPTPALPPLHLKCDVGVNTDSCDNDSCDDVVDPITRSQVAIAQSTASTKRRCGVQTSYSVFDMGNF